MSKNNTINTLINADLPPSVDNALKNLTDKPTLTAGNIISDLVDLTFGPLSYWAEKARIKRAYKLEQFREKLLTSADKIPPEKLIEPSLRIIAQALEDARYCISEEKLQDMFVSLISHSMNADFSNFIHPSFSEIIKQMSMLDARIIALFKNEQLPGLPVCQYCIALPGTTSAPAIPEHIFLEIPEGVVTPNSVSLISLSRLGLLTISYFEFLHDETLYKKFSTHPFYTDLQRECPVGTVSIRKGVVRLTSLGRSFIRVCVPD
ncbi:MAG: DUF4393 domain-containing protein [Lachnospiraceae bacterium]|nr:DUF4393 domain-containing protein [Lachnospiraceae bacterium]MCM1239991.1 DUF4393 domain-containing protein [Lachnospiraceae bacterium]